MPKPSAPPKLSEEAINLVAERFRALGDASRLKLIIAIEAGEKNVSELIAATGLAQANTSKHLCKLTQAGILVRRKDGANVFYSLADSTVCDLISEGSEDLKKHLESQAKSFGR